MRVASTNLVVQLLPTLLHINNRVQPNVLHDTPHDLLAVDLASNGGLASVPAVLGPQEATQLVTTSSRSPA